MELRQIAYVEAVARFGGFTAAAEHLQIAQPAVSAQIRRLERELGTPLFDRTTRRVDLTAAGHQFLVRARTILREVERARGEADAHRRVIRGRVRIGATPVLGALPLPSIIGAFHRAYPGVRIALRSGLADRLVAAIHAGDLDVVVAPAHADDPRLDSVEVARESLVLITPADWGGARVRTLADVADQPFVCLPVGSGLHSILVAAADAEGITAQVELETYSPASIRDLVSAGVGVALVAHSTTVEPGPPVRVHDLVNPPPHPNICAVMRRRSEVPAATAAFFDVLRGAVRL